MNENYEKGTYCIGLNRSSTSKPHPFLFKVNHISKSIVYGTLEKNSHIPQMRSSIEIPVKDVLINLGSNPHPGRVYGVDTSLLYRGRKVNDYFGPVYWFYKPDSDVGKDLNDSLDKVFKTLKQNRLDFIVDTTTCIWEALPFNGEKYAGMYIRSKNTERRPNRFQIRPEIMPSTSYPYVIFHELGHHLHFEYVTGTKLNASWVRLYNTSIKQKLIKKEQSVELMDRLTGQTELLPSDFKTDLGEEDTYAYRMILRNISKQHSLSVRELDLLFEAGYLDDIREVWPIKGLSEKDLAPIISEYACKNVKELFAESFAFYMTKKKLPTSVVSLLEKSISYARVNHEKR